MVETEFGVEFKVKSENEWLPMICDICSKQDHTVQSCKASEGTLRMTRVVSRGCIWSAES